MVGQGSYSIVKLAYNVDEDTHYVSSQSHCSDLFTHVSHIAGNEDSLEKETQEERRYIR